MARACRRRHATEALEFERERSRALQAQLEEVVTELEGPRLDEEAFACMSEADAAVVRETLETGEREEDGAELERMLVEYRDEQEDEIARLQALLAESADRQRAFASYLDALDR